MNNVVIVDYGLGNIKSVIKAFEHVGASSVLSSDAKIIARASHLVLPGVGSFGSGIKELEDRDLINAIHNFVKTGNQLLGICLGMQMLFDWSEEYGIHNGIGLIPGIVVPITKQINGQNYRKVPSIGWKKIKSSIHTNNWNKTCLNDTDIGEYFYFVHSFMSIPKNSAHILAQYDYKGLDITASVQRDNITGLQFHPEKSGEAGLRILENFIKS